jgi:hypothetical protein
MPANASQRRALVRYYVSNKSDICEHKRIKNLEERMIKWLNEWEFSFGHHRTVPKPKACKCNKCGRVMDNL